MNEWGFYIIFDDFIHFVFWRNLLNVVLIILLLILITIIYRIIIKKRNEEKTTTFTNLSSIKIKWNRKVIITFSDSSLFIGKLKNNLPHGKGLFKKYSSRFTKIKFNEGNSQLVKIYKTENGYNYQIIEENNCVINNNFIIYIKWLVVINCIALLIAIAKMPYGYYFLLRIFTTITCCAICYSAYILKKIKTVIVSGIIILIYNPIFKLHFDKEIWIFINLFSIGILIILFNVIKNDSRSLNYNL